MSGYSIVILVCSTTLSHSDCQPETALDVVRGPQVENVVMCSLNAQMMMARTDLVQGDGSQYMKVVCAPSKTVDEWKSEIEQRKAGLNPNHSSIDGHARFTYFSGPLSVPGSRSPDITSRSYVIAAAVERPGDGVLVAAGGVAGGYALFVKDGRPTYEYNRLGQTRYRITSSEPLPSGKSAIRVEFKYDGGGPGKGGALRMFLNDKSVAEGRVEMTTLASASSTETFDIGLDTGSPVSDQYVAPFEFSGVIDKVEVIVDAEQ